MLFGGVSKKHVMHRDVSGSDLEKVVKSQSRILNEGLGGSRILPFYTPLIVNIKWLFHPHSYFIRKKLSSPVFLSVTSLPALTFAELNIITVLQDTSFTAAVKLFN